MNLKNRKIYGITSTSDDAFYVNFGESRYAYVSIENVYRNISTWKFNITDKSNGFSPLLDVADNLPKSFYFDVDTLEFIKACANSRRSHIKEKVIFFKEYTYLIESKEYIKIKDGAIAYKKICEHGGYVIKYCSNGTDGYCIFNSNALIEDRLFSIEKCKDRILVFKNQKITLALLRFKTKNGRTWKSKLLKKWDDGIYSDDDKADIPYLQQARNLGFNLKSI